MRPLRRIVLHASGRHGDTLQDIDSRHRWRDLRGIGFHYVLRESGRLERGRRLKEAGAHCLGFNADSVGICLCGTGTATMDQQRRLHRLLKKLIYRYPGISLHSVRELDPWVNDPLRLDMKKLRREMES